MKLSYILEKLLEMFYDAISFCASCFCIKNFFQFIVIVSPDRIIRMFISKKIAAVGVATAFMGAGFAGVMAPAAHGATPVVSTGVAMKTITYKIQFDSWNIHNRSQLVAANKTNSHGVYNYRADVAWDARTGKIFSAPLWNNNPYQSATVVVDVNVPLNATSAQILAAEKANAAAYLDVKSGHVVKPALNKDYVSVYVIPAGAWDAKTSWKKGTHTKGQILAASKNVAIGETPYGD